MLLQNRKKQCRQLQLPPDMVSEIQIKDFDYNLPEERIPLHPLEKRDECKLLVCSPQRSFYHRKFKELPELLPPGAFMIYNDTKVINARLSFHKETGAVIELFLLEPILPSDYALNFQERNSCVWKCLVGNSKKWKEGEISTQVSDNQGGFILLYATRLRSFSDGSSEIKFSWNNNGFTFGQIIESAGKIPIPPYLNREAEESDLNDYQTVYARVRGSVAAPTAGLHFTPEVFENLNAHAVKVGKVTLHVGAGTFRPVKSDKIGDHDMHSEPFTVTRDLIKSLIEWKTEGRPVVAVGTTTVRTLESLPYIGYALAHSSENPYFINQWDPYKGLEFDTIEALKEIDRRLEKKGEKSLTASTSIMIAPGFQWRITDCMITNFHQPKSTLLLLVSSFLGGEEWRRMYEEALAQGYRFLSYGDACLLIR